MGGGGVCLCESMLYFYFSCSKEKNENLRFGIRFHTEWRKHIAVLCIWDHMLYNMKIVYAIKLVCLCVRLSRRRKTVAVFIRFCLFFFCVFCYFSVFPSSSSSSSSPFFFIFSFAWVSTSCIIEMGKMVYGYGYLYYAYISYIHSNCKFACVSVYAIRLFVCFFFFANIPHPDHFPIFFPGFI